MRAKPLHFAVGSFLLFVPAAALAQPLLDLGAAPQAPAAGQGTGTVALAEEMRRQADELEHKAGARDLAMAAVRKLARALLSSGEQMGGAGSQRIVIGRTLVRGMSGIDRQIGAMADEPGEARATLAARDLNAAVTALENPGADAWRTVRDGLAGLEQAAPPGPTGRFGWVDVAPGNDGPLAGEVDAWLKAPGVTAETGAAIKGLDALAETGMNWPAYRSSSRHLRAAIRAGAALLTTPAAWVPEPARRAVGDQFNLAIKALGADAARDTGMESLRRLARFGALTARVNALEESPAVKRVRASLAQAIAVTAPDAVAEAKEVRAFDRVLELVEARAKLPDEKVLLRQVRPAWRTLGAGLKASEQKLELALIEVLTHPDAMTDPGVAAIVASHRRAIQDMDVLTGLNATLSEPPRGGGEPAVAEKWKRVGDRVFKLGQDLAKAETKDAAIASLRTMAEQIESFTKLPGEESLREAARLARTAAEKSQPAPRTAWSVVTGGRETALNAEISDRRGGWLAGWDKAGYAGSAGDVERLRALRGLLAVLEDAAAIVPVGDAEFTAEYAALQSWPGWELSPEGFKAIAGGMAEETGAATKAMVEGDAARCTKLVEAMRRDRAAALLAGRLSRLIAARGMGKDVSALVEVGAGGPVAGVSWMGAEATEIADVCRYAEEAAAARRLGAKDRGESVLKFVNARAERALALIAESAR